MCLASRLATSVDRGLPGREHATAAPSLTGTLGGTSWEPLPTFVGEAAGSITGPGSLLIPELQEGLMAEESTAPTPPDAIDVQSS